MKYLSILFLALAFITSCGPSQSEQDAGWKNIKDNMAQRRHEIDEKCAETILHMVEVTQGELAAQELLYCQQHGYPVTFDTKSGSSDVPVIVIGGDSATPPPISNRHKAQCDSIVKTENRSTREWAARKAAEERRKDEAYDKAHKK